MSTKSNRVLRTVMFHRNDVSKLLQVHVHVRQFVHHSLLDYHFGEIILAGGQCVVDVM